MPAKSKLVKVTDPHTGEEKFVQEDVSLSSTKGFSFFEDDEGDCLYSGTVYLEGHAVKVRELSATEYAECVRREKEIEELKGNLYKCKTNEEAEPLAEQIQNLTKSLYDYTIGCAVAGWDLKRPDGEPVPYSAEAAKNLRLSQKLGLHEKIIQRSSSGREADFLSGRP